MALISGNEHTYRIDCGKQSCVGRYSLPKAILNAFTWVKIYRLNLTEDVYFLAIMYLQVVKWTKLKNKPYLFRGRDKHTLWEFTRTSLEKTSFGWLHWFLEAERNLKMCSIFKTKTSHRFQISYWLEIFHSKYGTLLWGKVCKVRNWSVRQSLLVTEWICYSTFVRKFQDYQLSILLQVWGNLSPSLPFFFLLLFLV